MTTVLGRRRPFICAGFFLKIQINFSHIYVKCYMGNIKVETKHDLRYLEIIINILHKKEKKS